MKKLMKNVKLMIAVSTSHVRYSPGRTSLDRQDIPGERSPVGQVARAIHVLYSLQPYQPGLRRHEWRQAAVAVSVVMAAMAEAT